MGFINQSRLVEFHDFSYNRIFATLANWQGCKKWLSCFDPLKFKRVCIKNSCIFSQKAMLDFSDQFLNTFAYGIWCVQHYVLSPAKSVWGIKILIDEDEENQAFFYFRAMRS